jgi:hypothetical protein
MVMNPFFRKNRLFQSYGPYRSASIYVKTGSPDLQSSKCHNFITSNFWRPLYCRANLADCGKLWVNWHNLKTNFDFYVGLFVKIHVWWAHMHVWDTDLIPLSFCPIRIPWKSFGSLQSIGLLVVGKSAGSEDLDFTSMDALLYGPWL